MASSLSSLARRTLLNRTTSSYPSLSSARLFSTSSPAFARRSRLEEDISVDEVMEYVNDADTQDSPSSAHLMLQEQRIVRHYLRLIENEMPNLVAFRKKFVPPTSARPLIVRSVDHLGENNPLQNKKTMVVAVDDLPLKDDMAKKRFVLLAGPRWTPSPPADAGISKYADWGTGFIKIACEDYPQPAMNLKWISDTVDKLVEKANAPNDAWQDLPVDLRHVFAKSRKAKKGEHLRGRILAKPTIRDFPPEWLPKPSVSEQSVLSSS